MLQVQSHCHGDLIFLSGGNNRLMGSMEEHRVALGRRVAQMRERLTLTQPQLAFNAGITQPSLWAIENGATKEVTARTLIALCRALGTTWEYLWDGSTSTPQDAANESELVATYRGLPGPSRLALMQSARVLRAAQTNESASQKVVQNATEVGRIPKIGEPVRGTHATEHEKVADATSAHQLEKRRRKNVNPAVKRALLKDEGAEKNARRKAGGVPKQGTGGGH